MDEYLGTIVQFGFNFQIKGWFVCHGQAFTISQNPALFSLLGTTFGGNGVNTFNIPDLRVKKADGSYYQFGEIMSNGLPYIESYICYEGIYPPRD